MKKRILSIALVLTLALGLTACGNEKANTNENTNNKTSSTEDASTDEVVNGSDATDDTSNDAGSTDKPDETETTTTHEHKYTSTVTKEATCTENGERVYTCECKESYTEPIPAFNHTYSKYEYNNDATVEKDGTKTATCATCGFKNTVTATGTKLSYTYTDMNKTMYTTTAVNVRELPNSNSNKVGSLAKGVAVTVTGQCKETSWYRITFDGNVAYVSNNYLTTTKPADPLPAKYKGIEENGPYKVVNGIAFTLDTEEEYGKYADRNNAFYTKLCEAGYNVPVYWDAVGAWYMLYTHNYWHMSDEALAEDRKAMTELENYVASVGGTITDQSAGNFNICGDYYVRIDVE